MTGESYLEQSVRLGIGDMILAFSDGATEIFSSEGTELHASGFLHLAEETLRDMPGPTLLHDFSERLVEKLHAYRGGPGDLADDLTLMTLRRSPLDG